MKTEREQPALLIKGAQIADPAADRQFKGDILVKNGKIAAVCRSIETEGVRVLSGEGLVAAPGLVDMHVHLRDPGQTHKEDIETGCRAAAAGGVTALAAMPNTVPAADSAETIRYVLQKAKKTGIRVFPIAAVTCALKGEHPVDFEALASAGAVAFSDDGRPVLTAAVMAQAMRSAHALGKIVISHCEDPSLAAGGLVNEGNASRELGVKGLPAAAEEVQVARETALAAALRIPVHIAHVSTAGSVALIRDAKRRGVPVTCETCPHYFSMDESRTLTRDADYRMNPPLRTPADVAAIVEGLQDGTIDAIVTDHAPHAAQEKADFAHAPNGVVGLETSLAAGITFLVEPGYMSLLTLLHKMAAAPSRILGVEGGTLALGARADIVLFNPEEEWTVRPEALRSRSHNTPFKGMTLRGRVRTTISGGEIVYEEKTAGG